MRYTITFKSILSYPHFPQSAGQHAFLEQSTLSLRNCLFLFFKNTDRFCIYEEFIFSSVITNPFEYHVIIRGQRENAYLHWLQSDSPSAGETSKSSWCPGENNAIIYPGHIIKGQSLINIRQHFFSLLFQYFSYLKKEDDSNFQI